MPHPDFSREPTKSFNVGVVGGGISGLILALSLLSNGVPVTLYEAASKFGEIGAGVSFGPNATRAMKLISPRIYEAFEARASRNQSAEKAGVWFDFRYGEDCGGKRPVGEKITTVICEGGQASVHRAHFLDELVKLLPDGVARFGLRATSFVDEGENGVVLYFSNGERVRHDAIVGCDGIKSKIRPCLLGDEHPAARAVYSGKYAYRGLIPMADAKALVGEELAQNAQMYLGRHGHILTFAIEKGKTMNGMCNACFFTILH
jgi:salicylate hydroxylase